MELRRRRAIGHADWRGHRHRHDPGRGQGRREPDRRAAVASRYRALLIGNSTYPADEHNLQALKGPVKDIAVLNRALADPATGLFADVDVALLPEATSSRVIRSMGRFFGT